MATQIMALMDGTFFAIIMVAPIAITIEEVEWSVSVLVVAIKEVDRSWFMSPTH